VRGCISSLNALKRAARGRVGTIGPPLGRVRHVRAELVEVERLEVLLGDADESVRANAAVGLARQSSPAGLPVLEQILQSGGLVPDQTVNALVADRIEQPDCSRDLFSTGIRGRGARRRFWQRY